MKIVRHPVLMLFAGALAGFISGLSMPSFYGVRGALFGFFLSLTVLWVQKKGWHWNKLIPGIVLGLILFIIPNFTSLKSGSLTLLNCTIFIPVYTFCYLQPKFYRVVLLLLPAGALCTATRIAFFRGDETFTWIDMYEVHFIQGTLLFLALWLVFMWLTDPRFRKRSVKPLL
jgi:hypothetical protein